MFPSETNRRWVLYVQMNGPMSLMSQYEHERVTSLCDRIVGEKNPAVFMQLLVELDAVLKKMNNHQAKRSGFEGDSMAT